MKPAPLFALVALVLPFGLATSFSVMRPAAGLAAPAAPSLAGLWRLDPTRSDRPPGPGGPGGRGPAGELRRGRDGGGPGAGGPGGPGGPRGKRPGRLPELLHITQKDGVIALADSGGVVLQRIACDGRAAAPPASGSTILELAGHWRDGRLVVERTGWRGNKSVDTWSLGEGGKTLTVETKTEGGDALPGFQLKRVYLKAGGA